MKTCLKGLQNFIKEHPKKNYKGYFIHNGRELEDREVRNLVDYGVAHGYDTEADIPHAEIELAMKGGTDVNL